ncbi:exodeoxyribonuclease III [Thermomonas flagellata]|uniref:exodeoxyribonuclease III n=1 Tax=Thermomonas flagellata TaxID=2888524 RepID=UPI001F04BE73|nr:exodeoxyribonuclease III [Thermomonas flagellata]
MRILTFNANGLRSAASKGFFDWFAAQDVDVLCVQETKAQEHQLDVPALRPAGYRAWFKDATTRKGYSGVAIYSRHAPDAVRDRLGWDAFDDEGRYLELRFGALSVVSLYLPSGSSGPERQAFKERVMAWLRPILDGWLASGRQYVLCGDWNIVRSRRDIKNWSGNQKNSGCLPHERAWLNALIADPYGDGLTPPPAYGWKDAFRVARGEAVEYSWWSQRGAARANNVGWRIDYQLCTPGIAAGIRAAAIFPEPKFSDHAPVLVDYGAPGHAR